MNGATRSTVCFRTEVGIGSAADDLSGRLRTASMMSSMVSGERRRSDTPGRARLYMGGEASPVFDLAIFSAKNWLNTSTPIAEDAGVRPRPSRASAVFHRPRGSVKGQGHQAALLSAALTREAGAAVTVRTYWAWETTATLCLLCGAQGAGRPRGRRGTGTYRVATRTACYR